MTRMSLALPAAFVTLLLGSTMALADDCADRMAALVNAALDVKPTRAMIVTETNGQTSENEMLMLTADHYMVKPVGTSAGQPWVLTYDGTAYQSADEGTTWTVAYSFDKEQTRESNKATVAAQAASIRNAVCGAEELEGVMYDTVEADMTNPEPYAFEISSRYWVVPDSGFVARAVTRMKSADFDSTATQTWELAPDLELPIPE